MMIKSHCYCFYGIIIIYFSLLIHTLASPPLHFCRYDQKDALLQFRDEFPSDESEIDGFLPVRSDRGDIRIDEVPIVEYDHPDLRLWNKSSDCCHWNGVTCDDKYGQVISLDLHFTSLNSSLKTNSSLFRLQSLRHLNLMDCNLRGEIPFSIGKLSRLTFIDLSSNNLVGKIPAAIGNLSRLTFVDLSNNILVGEIPDVIGKLNHLRNLSLNYNYLTGLIPSSIGNLSRLTNLELSGNDLFGEVLTSIRVIYLSQNNLSGNIPVSFANLTKLSLLLLGSNNLTSTLPSYMSRFHNLEQFDVAYNSFIGPFPKSLFSLPSLRLVDLEGNQLTGHIEFGNKSSSSSSKLQYLDLADNRFDGPVSKSIFKFPNLRYLNLSNNHFSGSISIESSNTSSSSSSTLQFLDLSHNRFDGSIPKSISELSYLVELRLSHNNLSESIPRSVSKLVNLWGLYLSNNKLKGQVPGFLWRMSIMTLSHNFLSSFENFSLETSQFQTLDLSSNSFRGPFPHWICKLEWITLLDLSNNLFNGSIPPCLKNSIGFVEELNLSNNSFSGVLPDIFSNATSSQSFDVSRNQLEGNFPKSLINCKELEFVNLESNRIKDKFPSWLGSLPSLKVLILRSNELYGPLYHPHVSIGFQSLRVIDASHNDFNGTLPSHYFSNWHEMAKSSQGHDYMLNFGNDSSIYRLMEMVNKGVETRFEQIREDFTAVDFSENRIYGKIPESVGFLKELRLLNLSGNAFTNDIPQSLANLTNLETLDLSSNKLSGHIPQDLGKLSFLSYMNFSHNLLHGPVPRGTQFQRQKCSSFLDNPGLYGLEEICEKSHVPNPTSQQPNELSEAEEQMFNWVAAAIAYGPGVFCGLVIGHIFTSHKEEWFTEKFGRRKLSVATIAP